MQETDRLGDIKEAVDHLMLTTLDLVVAKTGSNAFFTSTGWDSKVPNPPLIHKAGMKSANRVLNLVRSLIIPTEGIPEAWSTMAGGLGLKYALGRMGRVQGGVNLWAPCLAGPHATPYDILVRFAHLAALSYEAAGMPVVRDPYKILLGPPGEARFGIDGPIVVAGKKSRRIADAPPVYKILTKRYGAPIDIGRDLAGLVRHVRGLWPSQADALQDVFAVLHLTEPAVQAGVLAGFDIRPLDPAPGATHQTQEESAEVLALLNQLSNTYV